ncbi:MAG TPA: hypothetical protein PLO94_06630 [Chitinophagales bacterium]|nr:hypothetical protein [Chitinophagales bacterium]
MPAPSVTYTFSNGTTADATQVNQNFSDLVNGITDATKDLSIANLTVATALTASGTLAVTSTSTLSGNVTINNSKTLTISKTSSQLIFGTTNTTTISATAPSASRVFTIPDAGSDVEFVMAGGTQTIAGSKTFSSAVTINPTTNQLVLGVTNTTTISSTAPSASRTYTIPDAGSNVEFVMAGGTQTIAGAKTFSSAVTINPTTNQIVLGVTNTTTISSTAPSASRTYTIPDAGSNVQFVMAGGSQTIAGDKTFTGTTTTVDVVSSGSLNSLNMNTRNLIINGNFDVWQRGTSFTSPANGTYTSDRWRFRNSSAAVVDISRDTDVPTISSSSIGSNYSIKIDCTTVASGSTVFCGLAQYIEGLNYKNIHSKQVTLSFWIKSTKTGTSCVTFTNSNGGFEDRLLTYEYTINSTNTWEKKSITITLDNTGTWLFTNGIGLRITFTLYNGFAPLTNNTWGSTVGYGTSNQVNLLDNTANNVYFSQIQLELGSQATPFKPFGGSFTNDLLACYRYCIAPTSNNFFTSNTGVFRMTDYDANRLFFNIPLVVPLRAAGASLSNTTETTHFLVQTTAGSAQSGFAITLGGTQQSTLYLTLTKTTHGLTDAALVIFGSATPLLFSIEL